MMNTVDVQLSEEEEEEEGGGGGGGMEEEEDTKNTLIHAKGAQVAGEREWKRVLSSDRARERDGSRCLQEAISHQAHREIEEE